MAADIIERLKASASHQLTIYLPMPNPSPSNAESLKLQLLTARKKEWWPATADSLPQAVYLTTVKHTALAGIEPTTFRSSVRRATSSATDSPNWFLADRTNGRAYATMLRLSVCDVMYCG